MNIFRPVPDYPNLYVGMDGSLVLDGVVLEQKQYGKSPYLEVSRNGRRRGITAVHRLVAMAFLGECPEGMVVRHGLGGQLNNSVGNLCYGTQKENIQDSMGAGTHIAAIRKSATHCRRGHEYAQENVYIEPGTGLRRCRECLKLKQERRKEREKRVK